MAHQNVYIVSNSSYVPKGVMTNQDFEKMVDTSDQWIHSRTGIRERRIAAEDESTSDMGTNAALKALKAAKKRADDIDLILVATLSPDFIFPSTACIIQEKIGASKSAAMDIQAACSGFLYGLSVAKAYIQSGTYNNILLISSEKLSAIIDYEDRNTCVLFGDGAAAQVISNEGPGLLVGEVLLGADGSQSELLCMQGGGSRNPASIETVKQRLHYLKMTDGQAVFKTAIKKMAEAGSRIMQKANLTSDDIAFFVPHQANLRIIEVLAKKFNVPMERVVTTLQKYGNTSASTIGIALDELLQRKVLKEDDKLLLLAFGSGFTWGSAFLTFKKEDQHD